MKARNVKKIEQTLEGFENKIKDLKARAYGHLSIRDDLDALIRNMEQARDKISSQLEKNGDKKGHEWDIVEKSIYKDIESFNDAFRKAGELFDSKP
jgi:hypothetical protein